MRRQRPRTQLPPPPPPAEATEAFVEVDFVVVFPEVSYQALADQAGALAALAAELRAQWARTLNAAEEDVRIELKAGSLVVEVFAMFRGEDRLERADTTRKGVESFELVAETIQNSETIAAVSSSWLYRASRMVCSFTFSFNASAYGTACAETSHVRMPSE